MSRSNAAGRQGLIAAVQPDGKRHPSYLRAAVFSGGQFKLLDGQLTPAKVFSSTIRGASLEAVRNGPFHAQEQALAQEGHIRPRASNRHNTVSPKSIPMAPIHRIMLIRLFIIASPSC